MKWFGVFCCYLLLKLIKCQNIGQFQRPDNQNPNYQYNRDQQNQFYQQQLQQQFFNNPNNQYQYYNLFQKPIYNVKYDLFLLFLFYS